MNDKILLSEEGYKKIEDELNTLKTSGREEIAERLKVAKEFGDLSENSEYDEAKNAQELIEIKIAELEETLKNAEILDEAKLDKKKVQVGSVVELSNLKDNSEKVFKIVGAPEANLKENKISNLSPLGKALIGNKKGDVVSFEAPIGVMEYKILSVKLDI